MMESFLHYFSGAPNYPPILGVWIQLKTDSTAVLLNVISAPADLGKKAASVLCLNLEGLVSAEIPAKDKASTAFCDVRRKNTVGKRSSVFIQTSNNQWDLQTDSFGAATTS
jgi:hypothetical protein